jgi:ribose transport system permease protein
MTVKATKEADAGQAVGAGEAAGRSARAGWRARGNVSSVVESLALPVFWGVLVLVFSLVEPGDFPTTANFSNIFGSNTVLLVLSLALLLPLILGEFDLSIGSNAGLGAMVVALLSANEHWNILLACLVALAVCTVVGIVNAAFIVSLGTNTIIVTLAMATVVEGVTYWISGANTISGVSAALSNWTFLKTFLGIPIEFFYGLILLAVLWYFFRLTPIGEQALCVGQSRRVAMLSGIRVNRHRAGGFILAGLIAGFAGILETGTSGAADPSTGATLLLPAFAAAFLGSTTVQPGRFNPLGAGIAVYFLASGVAGLQLLGASNYVQDVFYGGALLVAVTVGTLVRRQSGRQVA